MLKKERIIEANDNSTEVSRNLIQTAFVKGQSHWESEGEVQSTLAATYPQKATSKSQLLGSLLKFPNRQNIRNWAWKIDT